MKRKVEIVIKNGGCSDEPVWVTLTILVIVGLYIFTLFI